jgi:hypothetical protein
VKKMSDVVAGLVIHVFAFLAVNKYTGTSSKPSESSICLLQDQSDQVMRIQWRMSTLILRALQSALLVHWTLQYVVLRNAKTELTSSRLGFLTGPIGGSYVVVRYLYPGWQFIGMTRGRHIRQTFSPQTFSAVAV